MKQLTAELNKNWEYLHPLLKLTYWIEKDWVKLQKKIKTIKLFFDSVNMERRWVKR